MDVELILEKLEEFHLVRLSKIRGDWYSVYCPFHNDGNEKRPSCGVSLHEQYRGGQVYPEGFWHCFTCQAAYSMVDAVSRILKLHDVSKTGVDWLSENIPGFVVEDELDSLIPEGVFTSLTNRYAIKGILDQIQPQHEYVTEEELSRYRFIVPYMYERKLTDEVIDKYDIGYQADWIPPGRKRPVPCITFPVRDSEFNTLFLVRRSIQGKLFNYPEGVVKPVYGIEMINSSTPSVIICESCINALTCVSWGYPAVALLGTGNRYQINQLRELGIHDFVLGFDGDDAGRRASTRIKQSLKNVALIWTLQLPEGKDINDLTKEEFETIYQNRA